MDDNKIDCTRTPEQSFQILLASCSANKVQVLHSLKETLSRLKGAEVIVFEKIAGMEDVSECMKKAVAIQPQMFLVAADERETELAAQLAYQYNNTFHNSPNILITDSDKDNFLRNYTQYRSFDLAFNKLNEQGILHLAETIKARPYDGAPVDFTRFKNLAYRTDGTVHFNS